MNSKYLKPLILAAFVLSSSCATTKQDFEAMSASERQAKVCYGSDAFRQRKKRLSSYSDEIEERQVVVSRGYRIHTQCRQVKEPAAKTDCGAKTSMGKTMCEGTAWTRDTYRTECTETPVSIDAQYEQDMLDKYRQSYATLSSTHSALTQQCFARVSEMPSEAAYIYYSENMEPR